MARPRKMLTIPEDIKPGRIVPNPCEYNGYEILTENNAGCNYRIVISKNGLYVMCVQVDNIEYGIKQAREYIDASIH